MTPRLAVTVAVLTYRRAATLDRTLAALAALRRPAAADVHFLVVDNDPDGSARAVVDARRADFDGALEHVVERAPGIPAARNRALDEARAHGADLLCFTDDDVLPDAGWLDVLVAGMRGARAAMAFGAVRFAPPAAPVGAWRRAIASGIAARGAILERRAAAHAARGLVALGATSNCAIDVAWMSARGLRFDEAMRESGGSDTALREAVRAAGGRLAWVAGAVVHEQLPPERLSLRYQFRRAVAHGMTTAITGRPVPYAVLRRPLGRIAAGVALMVVPVFGRGSFMLGLHFVGIGVGMLRARRGHRARLYAR